MATWQSDLLSCCTLPPNWQPMSSEVQLIQLTQSSDEFISVVRKVNIALNEQVSFVHRVQNPYLFGCYQLKKLEYKAKNIPVREVEMFHCTGKANIESITANNFDWRRCSRGKFGKGVSFSPSAGYANKYANYDIGCERALILTNVLVGSEVRGSESMCIPPAPHDTSVGNRSMVYVKFNDYEFYPSYVAYYTCKTDPRSRYRRYSSDDDFDFDHYDFEYDHDYDHDYDIDYDYDYDF